MSSGPECQRLIRMAYDAEYGGNGERGYGNLVGELDTKSARELEDLAQVVSCLSDAIDEAYQAVRGRRSGQ